MTNPYEDSVDWRIKLVEELRCIRCCLERLLMHFSSGNFVDYQLEKYDGQPKKIELTEQVLKFFLKYGKNYGEISESLGYGKSHICRYVKKYGLDKEFNIKAGGKKGVTPKNLNSLHIKGKLNPNWKGDDVGYQALHTWVRDRLGKPKACKHCGGKNNLDWANKSHEYKRDLTDWIPLCRKCHVEYDKAYRHKPPKVVIK